MPDYPIRRGQRPPPRTILLEHFDTVRDRCRRAAPKAPEILFTGFLDDERDRLEALAEGSGLKCRTAVSKNLSLLCVGDNAGPTKLEKAREVGAAIISAAGLERLIREGYDPD